MDALTVISTRLAFLRAWPHPERAPWLGFGAAGEAAWRLPSGDFTYGEVVERLRAHPDR